MKNLKDYTKNAVFVSQTDNRVTIKLDDEYYCKVFLIPKNDAEKTLTATQGFIRERFILEYLSENNDSDLYQRYVSSGTDFLTDFGMTYEDTPGITYGTYPNTGFATRFIYEWNRPEGKRQPKDYLKSNPWQTTRNNSYNEGGDVPMGYIITKTVPGKSLDSWLANQADALPEETIRKIAFQLCWLVGKLHTDYGIVHHDLHEDNVYVNPVTSQTTKTFKIGKDVYSIVLKVGDLEVRLLDFGSASVKYKQKDVLSGGNTWNQSSLVVMWSHAPPELYVASNYNRSYPADSYSIGYILMNLFAHKRLKDLSGVLFEFKSVAETNFHVFSCAKETEQESMIFKNSGLNAFVPFDNLKLIERKGKGITVPVRQMIYSRLFQFYKSLFNGKADFFEMGPISKNVIEKFSALPINVDFESLINKMSFQFKSFIRRLMDFKEQKRLEFGLPNQNFLLIGSFYHPFFHDFQNNDPSLLPTDEIRLFSPPLQYADTSRRNAIVKIIQTQSDIYEKQFENLTRSPVSANLVNNVEVVEIEDSYLVDKTPKPVVEKKAKKKGKKKVVSVVESEEEKKNESPVPTLEPKEENTSSVAPQPDKEPEKVPEVVPIVTTNNLSEQNVKRILQFLLITGLHVSHPYSGKQKLYDDNPNITKIDTAILTTVLESLRKYFDEPTTQKTYEKQLQASFVLINQNPNNALLLSQNLVNIMGILRSYLFGDVLDDNILTTNGAPEIVSLYNTYKSDIIKAIFTSDQLDYFNSVVGDAKSVLDFFPNSTQKQPGLSLKFVAGANIPKRLKYFYDKYKDLFQNSEQAFSLRIVEPKGVDFKLTNDISNTFTIQYANSKNEAAGFNQESVENAYMIVVFFLMEKTIEIICKKTIPGVKLPTEIIPQRYNEITSITAKRLYVSGLENVFLKQIFEK